MRVFPLLAFIAILTANAAAIDSNVKVDLLPSGAAREMIEISFTASQDADEISYGLLSLPENLKVYENSNLLEHEVIEDELYEVVIKKQIRRGQRYNLRMEFDIKGLVEQAENTYIFSFKYIPVETDNFNFELKLPKGFVLADISSAISPAGYKINTDGRTIVLNWQLQNINEEQSFIVIYERGVTNNNSIAWWLAFVAIAIIGGVAYYLYHIKNKHKTEKKEIVDNVLSQDEKRIVEIIKSGTDVTQKQVVKETGFSKAKVSKIIRRLDEKGIVEKKPWMATNKLKLKHAI